ncbi:MAG: hypothetical protein ACO1OB_19055 [Archangium sp.]
MPNEIGRSSARPVPQPTRAQRAEDVTPRAEPPRQVEPAADAFVEADAAPVRLDAALPQVTSDARVFRAGELQTPAPSQDVEAIRRRADDFRAWPAERDVAMRELGDLAESGNRDAVRALSLMSSPEAARQLIRAPGSALSSSDYASIARNAGSDPAVQAELRTRITAGDANAISGVASVVNAGYSSAAELASALASAPSGALTERAWEALGKAAGGGNLEAISRLTEGARAGDAGALKGLEAMNLHGISRSHRDQALDILAEAAIENPAAMDTLRAMHERGSTRRGDGVDSYFNAASRLTDPARLSAEVQRMHQRGELAGFIADAHPQRLTEGPLRGELMKVALGPPANEAVSRALSEALRSADFQDSAMLREFGPGDIDRARAGVMEGLTRRAETDPDMRQLSQLLQVAHRASSDPEFAARIDQEQLQGQLRELLAKPSVQQTLSEVRAQSDVFNVGDRMAERIESPAYQDRLRLMSPEERQRTLQQDLGQLAQVDPVRAQAAAARITAEQIAADPVGALADMPEAQRAASIATVAANLGVPPAAVGQMVQSMLDSRAKGQPIPGVDQLLSGLSLSDAQRGALTRAFGTGANAANGLAAAISAVGLVDAAMAGDVMGAIGNGANMAASLSTIFSNSSGWVGAAARWGGVIGNGASAVLSGISAYEEAMRGDYLGATGNGLMAVGAGALAASPFTGHAAPAVAVVGAALIGAGWVTNQFSEEDSETAARQLGLYRD